MTTLTAPDRMRGREQASELLRDLPADLTGMALRLEVVHGTLPTGSFIDQLVLDVLVRRRAEQLAIVTTSNLIEQLAHSAATDRNVGDRLVVVPS